MLPKKTISKSRATENVKNFRKELKEKAWNRVANSKIPDLVRMGMLMSNALALLSSQIDARIRAELRAEGMQAKANGGDGDMEAFGYDGRIQGGGIG